MQLDLVILAAKTLDGAVGVVSDQITSLVDAVGGGSREGSSPSRVVNKFGVRLLRVVDPSIMPWRSTMV